MSARKLIAPVLIAALAAVPAQAAGAKKKKPAAQKCATLTPLALKFERPTGGSVAILRWKPPAKRAPRPKTGRRKPATYRVYRGGLVVGQTTLRMMRVRVRVGRTYTLTIAGVDARGKATRCRARVIVTDSYRPPAPPRMVSVGATDGASTTITWEPAQPGDSLIKSYRVLRDGRVFKQTLTTAIPIPLASNRSASFTVTAIDRRGVLSAPSEAVKITTGHTPPPAPTNVRVSETTDSAIALQWAASVPKRGRVAAYRVLRDGKPLFQVAGTTARATNLYASRAYTFSVQAIDTLGGASDPSPPLAARTADPDPTEGRLNAFLLASTDQSFRDFQAHYRQIGTVYPTYFDCTPAGVLIGDDDPLITRWAQARRVEVLSRFNCQRTAVLHRILSEPALRASWIDQIATRVSDSGADGASLDFEAGLAADRNAYSAFVADLAARLHAQGQRLTVIASAKIADVMNHPRSTFFDYKALAAVADHIFVMAWGIKWATSAPGAQDDIVWVTKVANFITQTVPDPSKFIMGTQLYAMDWASGGGPSHPADSYEFQDAMALASTLGVTPTLDAKTDAMTFNYASTGGIPRAVWYSDATTVGNRFKLATDRGMGMGVWRLGKEDQRLWDNPLLAAVPSDPAP